MACFLITYRGGKGKTKQTTRLSVHLSSLLLSPTPGRWRRERYSCYFDLITRLMLLNSNTLCSWTFWFCTSSVRCLCLVLRTCLGRSGWLAICDPVDGETDERVVTKDEYSFSVDIEIQKGKVRLGDDANYKKRKRWKGRREGGYVVSLFFVCIFVSGSRNKKRCIRVQCHEETSHMSTMLPARMELVIKHQDISTYKSDYIQPPLLFIVVVILYKPKYYFLFLCMRN